MVLTQKDFDEIEQLLDDKLEEKFEQRFKHLPTKEEFFSKMDEVVGELKAIREEHPAITNKLSNHEDRIAKLESSQTTS